MLTDTQINSSVVDYAYPCMMAEKALKQLHNAMLERDHDAAFEQALIALAEIKLTLHAIQHEKEKQIQTQRRSA